MRRKNHTHMNNNPHTLGTEPIGKLLVQYSLPAIVSMVIAFILFMSYLFGRKMTYRKLSFYGAIAFIVLFFFAEALVDVSLQA